MPASAFVARRREEAKPWPPEDLRVRVSVLSFPDRPLKGRELRAALHELGIFQDTVEGMMLRPLQIGGRLHERPLLWQIALFNSKGSVLEVRWHRGLPDFGYTGPPALAKELERVAKAILGMAKGGRLPGDTSYSREEFEAAYRQAYARLKRLYRNPRQDQVAEELGISERTLRDYLARWRLPWPPR